MSAPVKPYPELQSSKKEQVAQMFDNISPRYDFLNRVLSVGIDIIWRKKAVAILRTYKPKIVIDVATGTGDFAVEALKGSGATKIVGVDISEGMLVKGREKMAKLGLSDKIEMHQGDSENLHQATASFDAAIVAFGVRNFENLAAGMAEMNRVLKPGAPCIVLEFSRSKTPVVKQLFGFYFRYILPQIGKALSADSSAYGYLHDSVQAFPEGADFLRVMDSVGFKNTRHKPLTFGICSIYIGEKR